MGNGILYGVENTHVVLGDLFTQDGSNLPVLADSDILKPGEAFRRGMDCFSHSINVKELGEKLATEGSATPAYA
jgi:hypothetical protein